MSTSAAASAPHAQDAWSIRRVLTWTTDHFTKKNVDAPRLTAEVLLAHVLQTDRVRLYVDLDRPLQKEELATYRKLIERRCQGEPSQYLTGVRDFYNRRFQVDARVLVPRPETELLVEAVLHHLPKDTPSRALDLCTGSGCIAITLAAERPMAHITGTDLSGDALAVATLNAQALGVFERTQWHRGDLFDALKEQPLPLERPFDVVVSNPPYIATSDIETLSPEVKREPRMALDGGGDGLLFLQRIIEGAQAYLTPGGLLALELGEHQGPAVRAMLDANGYTDVRIEKDLARLDRLAFGTRPGRTATA